ncbi:DUF4269 domain-containing protein [Terrimonas sp. NA20]|uniref:DUF4269 domain-containing protein n=1 Tax=Terrimonas ginsenosidimutans TaxID=2908004 RepID=A0ABS9KWS9_9BACT|nr:DUF4269 domain-containing protein [Terrimonas ginsenosidimutans]MCG2616804.1 DUF4269 domain-containing protein [Terrimonas ginsenosidimutans]
MDINFEDIGYLQHGTTRQQQAFRVLTTYHILEKLEKFQPLLVGTIPLNIDIEGSDLDIVCCWNNEDAFTDHLFQAFGDMEQYESRKTCIREERSVICSFMLEGFPVEIFGQAIASNEQMGYRHLLIENKLLNEKGEHFRKEIIRLKEKGLKTEPAFATLLGLEGDPYIALLKLET